MTVKSAGYDAKERSAAEAGVPCRNWRGTLSQSGPTDTVSYRCFGGTFRALGRWQGWAVRRFLRKVRREKPWAVFQATNEGNQNRALRLGVLHLILLELPVEGGLSNAEHACRRQLVSARFPERAQNGSAFQLLHGQQFVLVWCALAARIVQVGRQIAHVNDGSGAHGHRPFDGIFEFADVARPVIGN